IVAPVAGHDAIARGWMGVSLAVKESWWNDAPWAGLAQAGAALASFREVGHAQGVQLARMVAGLSLWCLGAFQRAAQELSLRPEETVSYVVSVRKLYLVGVMADSGALEEALSEATLMAQHWHALGASHEGRWRWMRGDVLRRLDRLGEAERETLAALDLLGR